MGVPSFRSKVRAQACMYVAASRTYCGTARIRMKLLVGIGKMGFHSYRKALGLSCLPFAVALF